MTAPKIPVSHPCYDCDGTGECDTLGNNHPDAETVACDECGGSGRIFTLAEQWQIDSDPDLRVEEV